jgi:riboflavin kinase/FMN adenylyltransferase
LQGRTISSTYLRYLIRAGRLKEANRLLPQPVGILGTVIRGRQKGKLIGFPTANVNPHHEVLPPCGVYAVRVGLENRRFKGVCYIGTRPTFRRRTAGDRQQQGRLYIEVHILNFKEKIYGKDIEIRFIKKIRNEKKFSSVGGLAKQIRYDCLSATQHLP